MTCSMYECAVRAIVKECIVRLLVPEYIVIPSVRERTYVCHNLTQIDIVHSFIMVVCQLLPFQCVHKIGC